MAGLSEEELARLEHAAWFAEKLKVWTDSAKVPEDAVDRGALLTAVRQWF